MEAVEIAMSMEVETTKNELQRENVCVQEEMEERVKWKIPDRRKRIGAENSFW